MVSNPASPAPLTLRYDGDLRAAIPLLGSAVEQATAAAIRSAVAAEERVAARRLAQA